MKSIGKALSQSERKTGGGERTGDLEGRSGDCRALENRKKTGIPAEVVHKRGEKTAWERIDNLVDPGTFLPLASLYDPEFNQEATTGVVTGLAQISGRYAVVIASDNRCWPAPGFQARESTCSELRTWRKGCGCPWCGCSTAAASSSRSRKRFYAGRRSGGRTFFRHAELAEKEYR